jgi:hypothetical protein
MYRGPVCVWAKHGLKKLVFNKYYNNVANNMIERTKYFPNNIIQPLYNNKNKVLINDRRNNNSILESPTYTVNTEK